MEYEEATKKCEYSLWDDKKVLETDGVDGVGRGAVMDQRAGGCMRELGGGLVGRGRWDGGGKRTSLWLE